MSLQQAQQLFISLYYGQKVAIYYDFGYKNNSLPKYYTPLCAEFRHLLLRSFNQLTDDECLNVAAIFDLSDEQIADTDLREWIEALFNETAGYYIDGYTGNQLLSTVDYLRSIGILLAFTYIDENNKPTTFQPYELVELGWVEYLKS